MSKIKEFFAGLGKFFSGLKKSTRVTLISCGSFIVMTAIILLFFVLFPISPPEKAVSLIKNGRSKLSNESDGAVAAAETDSEDILPIEVVTTAVQAANAQTTVTVTEFFVDPDYVFTGRALRVGDPNAPQQYSGIPDKPAHNIGTLPVRVTTPVDIPEATQVAAATDAPKVTKAETAETKVKENTKATAPVVTKASDEKPDPTKPAATKAAEEKPDPTKPAEEKPDPTKPAEEKPAVTEPKVDSGGDSGGGDDKPPADPVE